MKRILLSIMLIFPFIICAQTPVNFTMRMDGTFLDPENKSYTVVEFPGRSAKDLYDEVLMNVLYSYVQPADVVSYVPEKMIKVRGYKSGTKFTDSDNITRSGDMYYTIIFYFKDGKVKVMAPSLENIKYKDGVSLRSTEITPQQLAELYNNSGNNDYKFLNLFMNNSIINYLLGLNSNSYYPYRGEW